ncbi:MAG: hypothetical protein JNL39_12895 [Opitutaceae bacterium]|nr:hypothetical protein [Opitutaceae bacterium]
MPLAVSLLLIVLAAGWRIAAVHAPALSNFAPLMALTFCGAVYFRDKRLWLVPFAALLVSDLYLDHHHATIFGETWTWPSVLIRAACFAAALPLGAWVAQRKGWLTLLGGALTGSLIFYVVTNTDAWVRDPGYVKTFAGWAQALTVGRPEFPPTIWFFRNTLVSDLLFTGLFAAAMEFAALRRGTASLFGQRAAA